MMNDGICNARIESTSLTTADYGILSGWVFLDYGSTCQGFGGHCLGWPTVEECLLRVGPHCAVWIAGVLRAAGVDTWERVPGSYVRVRLEGGFVQAIGHIIRDDAWFDAHADLEKIKVPGV